MTKEKAIIEMILTWLDTNMDEPPPEGIQEDSANLKERCPHHLIYRMLLFLKLYYRSFFSSSISST